MTSQGNSHVQLVLKVFKREEGRGEGSGEGRGEGREREERERERGMGDRREGAGTERGER